MSRYRSLIVLIIILLGVGLVYSRTLHHDWHFDDTHNIGHNKHIHLDSWNWENIKKTFFAGGLRGDIYHPHLYRPVAMFSLAVNWHFGQNDVFGYHIVNILIHLITTVFLFLFIKQTLRLRNYQNDTLIAGIATALWALNPIQISAVTYIIQRMASMAGMFGIMSAYFYLQARTTKRPYLWAISILAMALAIGSKENAIMLPFCLLLYDLIFIQGITKESVKRTGFILFCTIGIGVILTLLLSGIETFTEGTITAGYARRDFTLAQRLLTEPRVIFFYLLMVSLPSTHLLSLSHNIPLSTGLLSPPQTLVCILLIAALIALAVVKMRQWKLLSFTILFFFMNHVIEGSIWPLELCFEHRNYVPSMFLFVPIAVVLVVIIKKINVRILKVGAVCFIGAMLLYYSGTTFIQNKVWETDLKLWQDTSKKNPDPRALFNYAGALYKEHQWKEAMYYWQCTFQFNKLFGTNYDVNPNIIPYGRVMYWGYINYNRMKLLLKEGWENLDQTNSWSVRFKPKPDEV